MRCCECGKTLRSTSFLCIKDNKVACGPLCATTHVRKTTGVFLNAPVFSTEYKEYIEAMLTKEIEQ